MKQQIQVKSNAHVEFKPAPIPADWVVAGHPVARNSVQFLSADKLQFTLYWHCTAGSFRWHYDEDETIMVLEGGMTLVFDCGAIRHCAPGDLVFFPAGTTCVWIIEHEVKKIAFFREPAPSLFAVPIRLMRKLVDASGLRRLLRGQPNRAPGAAAPATA